MTKVGQGCTPGAMRAAERIKHYEFNLEHAAQIIDRGTNCRGLAESNRVLLEALRKLSTVVASVVEHSSEDDSEGNIVIRFNCAEWLEIAMARKKSEALIAAANGEKL